MSQIHAATANHAAHEVRVERREESSAGSLTSQSGESGTRAALPPTPAVKQAAQAIEPRVRTNDREDLVRYLEACGGTEMQLGDWACLNISGGKLKFKSPEGKIVCGRSTVAEMLGLTPLDRAQTQRFAMQVVRNAQCTCRTTLD